jgi:A/G-specific adenine glycosylase
LNKKQIREIRTKLIAWGRNNYCDYRWRDVDDYWLAILAALLLQRTNAPHVAKNFEEVSQVFPSPVSVLNASKEDLAILEGKFGLDRRLRSVVRAAEYFDSKDVYPTNYEELLDVYGIGHYTASAFLSLHMNQRALLVDSNVSRWLARMTGNERPVAVPGSGNLLKN